MLHGGFVCAIAIARRSAAAITGSLRFLRKIDSGNDQLTIGAADPGALLSLLMTSTQCVLSFLACRLLTIFGLVLFSAVPGGAQERRQENTKQVVILYPHRTLTPLNRPASSGKPRKESNSNTAYFDAYASLSGQGTCPASATQKSDRVCGLNRGEFEIRSDGIRSMADSVLTRAEYFVELTV